MKRLFALLLLAVHCFPAWVAAQESPIRFHDVTDELGIAPLVEGWAVAHSGVWGDVDGDGRPDLYLGAFADRPQFAPPTSLVPNMLLLNRPTGFVLSDDPLVKRQGTRSRMTFGMAVDLDNDGDLDLISINHEAKPASPQSLLLENDGRGGFTDRTPRGGDWPHPLAARNATVIDFDADGLLDLLITDGDYAHRRHGKSRVFALRQTAPWQFTDVTEAMGLPLEGTPGTGLAVGDVNDDGMLDVFVADANKLFVSTPDRRYQRVTLTDFARPRYTRKGDAMTCGAALADLDGDGRLDLVTTVHAVPGQMDVYMHRGIESGMPRFERVTAALGLEHPWPRTGTTGLPIKGAHVALQDFDNDGRRDIMLNVSVANDAGEAQPLVLWQQPGSAADAAVSAGSVPPLPHFTLPPWDRAIAYFAQAPVADYDLDGRLDVCHPSWFEQVPTRLYRNATPDAGQWIAVAVEGRLPGLNRQGIGATVRIYQAGHAGDPAHLLGRSDITLGNGYSSGELALAHFGLGSRGACDIVVQWQGHERRIANAAAGSRVTAVFGSPETPADHQR